MIDAALWVGGGAVGLLIVGTLWLMFKEGSPRARPWASPCADEGDHGRERDHDYDHGGGETGDTGDGGGGGDGDGD
jgi:hypothetical protein